VVSAIWPDEWMPYLVTKIERDQYGVAHPVGPRERVDMLTNPNAIINRSIPIILIEASVTFILDRARKHAATIEDLNEAADFIFDIMKILNPKQGKEWINLYEKLSDKQKQRFIMDSISLTPEGLLITNNGCYLRWETFNEEWMMRDVILKIYDKYSDIIEPYHLFVPKPKWGRDIYLKQDCIGYQYIMVLKQSGEKGFSVRSAGSISDESLPEKSNRNKMHTLSHSEKPIRFGEWKIFMFTINSFNCGNELVML